MTFNSSVSTLQKFFCRVTVIINDNYAYFIENNIRKIHEEERQHQGTLE